MWARRHTTKFNGTSYVVQRAAAAIYSAEGAAQTRAQIAFYLENARVLREGLTLPGAGTYSRSTLGYALARAGRRDEAEAILADLGERAREEYVSPVAFAMLQLALGQLAQALDWAERSLEERRGWLVYLKVNAVFDPLRGEPRFQELVERLRL